MSEKTVRELAEERGRRKALEEQLAAVRALPQPQFIPMPYPVQQPLVNIPSYPYGPAWPGGVTFEPVPLKQIDVKVSDTPPSRFAMLEINTASTGVLPGSSSFITSSGVRVTTQ